MAKKRRGWVWIIVVIFLILIIYSSIRGTYNRLVGLDEGVKSAWAQVENQYQRRFDLIPNYVETVKGYAEHERETFTAVTEARAKVGQMTITPEILKNPQAFAMFQQAQDGLGAALSRLMVVMERYPELKANQNFIRLQDELAGTENRIATERRRFNEAVRGYNVKIRSFPTVLYAGMLGFERAVFFEAVAGAEKAPKVEF
ncbi:LemA family protein [candidate division KSB1 bacterium]|nr:LemA family protein [candidate division KSB1 bacterium]